MALTDMTSTVASPSPSETISSPIRVIEAPDWSVPSHSRPKTSHHRAGRTHHPAINDDTDNMVSMRPKTSLFRGHVPFSEATITVNPASEVNIQEDLLLTTHHSPDEDPVRPRTSFPSAGRRAAVPNRCKVGHGDEDVSSNTSAMSPESNGDGSYASSSRFSCANSPLESTKSSFRQPNYSSSPKGPTYVDISSGITYSRPVSRMSVRLNPLSNHASILHTPKGKTVSDTYGYESPPVCPDKPSASEDPNDVIHPVHRSDSKLSLSRHYDPDKRNSSSLHGLRSASSYSLLPLSRKCISATEPAQIESDINFAFGKSDWDLRSTTQRSYKFSNDGFIKARSEPYRHTPSLKIGVEGQSFFSPEKRESFPEFSGNVVKTARPQAEPPRYATHLFGPFPNDPIYGITPGTNYSDKITAKNKDPDPLAEPVKPPAPPPGSRRDSTTSRFSEGTTTQSTFRDFSATSRDLRISNSLRPWSSSIKMGLEGEFTKQVSSREHYPERPYAKEIPSIRRPSLSVHNGSDHFFHAETTYRRNVENVLQFAKLRPSRRFDEKYRIADKIDWL